MINFIYHILVSQATLPKQITSDTLQDSKQLNFIECKRAGTNTKAELSDKER